MIAIPPDGARSILSRLEVFNPARSGQGRAEAAQFAFE
jgi:hypothetical protein